jgi:hypothetical protein
VTHPVAAPAHDADQPTPPPFSPTVVEEVLRQFDKTVRAHQLYEGNKNNPTYARSLELARAAFSPLWAATDSVTLQVSDANLTWHGVVVHAPEEKASDSLPWTLYKDGVRELTLTRGFEGEELEAFLAIIPRVRRALPLDDDLLSILWEQEFAHLSYRHVELVEEGAPISSGGDAGRWPVGKGEVVEDPHHAIEEARREQVESDQEGAVTAGGGGSEEATAPREGIVKMDDFDSAIYFLDEGEVKFLRAELETEYSADLRRVVLDALLDVFELQVDPLVRKEVVGHIDSLTLHLLAGRQFANVAYLLRETHAVLERARDVEPEARDRLRGLADRLSDPAALSQLLQAMDESDTLPPRAELEELFLQLRPSSLGTVFSWLAQSQNEKLRPLLGGAADRLASSNTGEVVRLISTGEGAVAMEAVRRAGALKTSAAVGALTKVLGEPYRELRLAAVNSMVEIGTPGAMQGLEKALEDADRDVRIAAIKALAAKAHRPALPKVTAAVKSKEIRDADRTERLAMFELFGILCGDGGVPYLAEVLNGKSGLFGRKEDPELRACAAVALGRVGTARAQAALQASAGEKDVVVRNAVARAMRGGGGA